MPNNLEDMLKDKLKADSVTALKSGDNLKVERLRYLISLIDQKELTLPMGQLTETDEIMVLQKELKNKEESRLLFLKGKRLDLVTALDEEIELLKSYLPQMMTVEEITALVGEMRANLGNDFGAIMRAVKNQTGGRASGELIARIIKEQLSGE